MSYAKDDFISNLMLTIAVLATIVTDIALKVTGRVQFNTIAYVILCIVLLFVNCYTYLPLYTIAFILLKVTGRLFLGWPWIILTIAVDLMIAPSVKDLRTPKY